MATIKDVAERAGVSIATVSNLINNKGNVSEEKHARIMEAISALNYRPNIIARNLKRNKTKFVAFVVPRFDGIYTYIYRGLASMLEPEGNHILVKTTDDDAYLEEMTIKEVVSLGVNGIIMVPVCPSASNKYEMLTGKEIPIVFIERQSSDLKFSSVTFDNHSIVQREAIALFERYGPERTALIVGPAGYSCEDACVSGFLEAYGEYCSSREAVPDGAFEDSQVLRSSLNKERAFRRLFDLLMEKADEFSCYLVSSVGVAESLKEALLMMKREAEICALDGDVWCTASASSENPRRVGREAIRLGLESGALLLEYLDNKLLFENKKITISSPDRSARFFTPQRRSMKKLNVLLLDCPSSSALMKMAEGYPNGGGEIDFEVLGYLELHDKLTSRLSSGASTNDVVMVDLPWINSFIENDYLADFSSLCGSDKSFVQELPKSIRDAFMKTGSKVYGLPIIATIQFLFYRKDLFEDEDLRWRFTAKYGLDLCPPRNWTEFNIVAEFFNRDVSPFSPVDRGTAINGLHPTGIVDEFLPRQWASNGRMLDPKGRLEVDSPENLRALENLCKTFSLVQEECLHYWWDEEFRQLIDGRLAMVVGFASHYPIPAEQSSDSAHYYNISVAPIPGNMPMLGGWMLGINKNSEAIEDSYSFIRWATRDERAIHSMLLGGAMPTNSACTSDFLKLYLPWMADMRNSFDTAGKREVLRNKKGRIVNPYWIDTQMSSKFLDAMQGKTEPKQALVDLEGILSRAQEAKGELNDTK
jgi:DNA-binding LacI/PurR family transcriptional regulator/ABC-type glycerol-3-phosphate transport system substrate-binding protein